MSPEEQEFERIQKEWHDRIASVNDEKSFLRFLRVLRENVEKSERECPSPGHPGCFLQGHWECHSTKDFLRSAEEWGSGDFGDGIHHGDPILRRIATMLFVARYKVRDPEPDRDRYD